MTPLEIQERYAKYESLWRDHVESARGHAFLGGACYPRFTERDKQEFIRTVATIDQQDRPAD